MTDPVSMFGIGVEVAALGIVMLLAGLAASRARNTMLKLLGISVVLAAVLLFTSVIGNALLSLSTASTYEAASILSMFIGIAFASAFIGELMERLHK